MKTWTRVAPGIYRHRNGTLYERPVVGGKPTFRKLRARTIKLAKEELAANRTDQARSRIGMAPDPYMGSGTVGELCRRYLADGCPDSQRRARMGTPLGQEKSRLSLLLEWWEDVKPWEIDLRRCDAYADWRMARVKLKRGVAGARAVDLELNTLKNVFRAAERAGLLRANPLNFTRPAYCRTRDVRHCRDCAPKDANELHRHAIWFFEERETEVYGWQMLFEALTGCRTSEALALRMDAKHEGEPGFIQNGVLWLARAKGGSNNFFKVHEALAGWHQAFVVWHQARFPDSPWWFPGSSGQKLANGLLSKAMRRSSAIICPGEPRTSHGLRSYYVTVRRSQGASDGQIAIELGQRTGPGLIVRVYGEATPKKLAWLPEPPMRPAWELWVEEQNPVNNSSTNVPPASTLSTHTDAKASVQRENGSPPAALGGAGAVIGG